MWRVTGAGKRKPGRQGRGRGRGLFGAGHAARLEGSTERIWQHRREWGLFFTLLNNSKALIKMFNFIESELGTCISSHENALFPSGVCLVTLA